MITLFAGPLGFVAMAMLKYLRVKIAIWLLYRCFAKICQSKIRRWLRILLVFVLAEALFFAVMWGAEWILKHAISSFANNGDWCVLAALYVNVSFVLSLFMAKREFYTLCGLRVSDWNWRKPNLGFFEIPDDIMPEETERKGFLTATLEAMDTKKEEYHGGDYIYNLYYRD